MKEHTTHFDDCGCKTERLLKLLVQYQRTAEAAVAEKCRRGHPTECADRKCWVFKFERLNAKSADVTKEGK